MANTGQSTATETIDHSLTEKLLDERTAGQLVQLLDKMESVVFLANALEDFLRRGPEIADSINELVVLLRGGIGQTQLPVTAGNVVHALQRFQEVFNAPQTQQLLESDIFDVRSVEVVGKAARALVAAQTQAAHTDPKRMGLVGLMRLLTDPEIQPAINFFAAFLREFSKELEHARAEHRS